MSRTGKKPITLPDKVKASVASGKFTAVGPLGQESVLIHPLTVVEINDKIVLVKRNAETAAGRATHGLIRALINNAVQGVSTGFSRGLEISGVGYRAEVKGQTLNLNLGFSHVVEYPIPHGIKITVQDQNKLTVSGSNRELVGRVASQIRKHKKPEPYKGKGIKYAGEVIIRKVGKAAAAAGGGK